MKHEEIFKKFLELGCVKPDEVACWFPNGKGSVRVRTTEAYGDLIFTYGNKKHWRIESVDSWLDSIRREVE